MSKTALASIVVFVALVGLSGIAYAQEGDYRQQQQQEGGYTQEGPGDGYRQWQQQQEQQDRQQQQQEEQQQDRQLNYFQQQLQRDNFPQPIFK
ncbi:MAG TPA: hypothetical protein VNF99_06985 [Stellaceae bacterium]|nr:hypothetical protein [Stellaceae bacterium]